MSTILNGETDSDTIDLTGKRMIALVVTGGSFSGSRAEILYPVGPTWLPVQDSFGRMRNLKVNDGIVTSLDSEQRELSKNQVFRLRSDTPQDGDCTITIITEVAI